MRRIGSLWILLILSLIPVHSCQTRGTDASDLKGRKKKKAAAKSVLDPTHMVGRHKGKKVDTNRWRPIEIPDQATQAAMAKQLPRDVSEYHLVRHINIDGKFQNAAVPKTVTELNFVIESFDAPVPAAHSMLLFNFPDDHPMYVFDAQTNKINERTRSHLYMSSEAARPKDIPFDLFRGTQGDFILVHAFYDAHYVVKERVSLRPDMEIVEVELNAKQRNDALAYALQMSRTDGYRKLYNTVNEDNCHGAALKVIDKVNYKKMSPIRRTITSVSFVSDTYPVLAKNALRYRGVLGRTTIMREKRHIKPLYEEYILNK